MTKTKTKSGPRAMALKAQINARAKLTNISTATGESAGYNRAATTAMVITLKVSMGAPSTVQAWDDFKRGAGGWQRTDWIDRELRKLEPPTPKAVKAKKGKAIKVDPAGDQGSTFDRAAARKKLEQQYDASLKTKYERECAKANAANAQFMERAASFAMFAALRGQDVELSLSPVQQGFKTMFTPNGHAPQLGSGELFDDHEATAAAVDDDGDDDE